MDDYSFYLKGTHRQTSVSGETLLQAARDAAFLLNVSENNVLLWQPSLPPLRSGATRRRDPQPAPVEPQGSERNDATTITLDLVSLGRAYCPVFLERAALHWHTWQHDGADQEARLRYTLMVCGAIYAISSAAALEQVCSHLLMMSEMPVEIMPPAFEVALQELVSLQAIFEVPYERLAYFLFLQVLALTCLAVPLEQEAIDQLRNALTPIEHHCSLQLRQIEAEQEETMQ